MAKFSGPYSRQTEMIDRIADAITGTDELQKPTGSRALDSLERLAVWFETHGGIPSPSGDDSSGAILYSTKAEWDAKRDLVAEKGTIYIYSDYQAVEGESGETQYIPGIKVGDGKAYLIDLPVANPTVSEQLIQQIAGRVAEVISDQIAADVIAGIRDDLGSTDSLVTPEDRNRWDGKVSSTVNDDDPENLILF